jgi:catechol 2,3-dioxygenase-like lactoylglutathione lyase family enzyme
MKRAIAGLALGSSLLAFAPLSAQAPGAAPTVGMMGTGVHASDLDRSIKFYRDGLGMVELRHLVLGATDEVIMGFSQSPSPPMLFLLHRRDTSGAPQPAVVDPQEKIVLTVINAEALVARLKAAGYSPGPINGNPQQGVKVFWVSDPDGHRLEVTERTSPSAARP